MKAGRWTPLVASGALACRRPVRRRQLRVLRPRLMAALDSAVEHGARVQRDRSSDRRTFRSATRRPKAARSAGGAARRAAVDRHGAARGREGGPRAVLDGPSDRRARRRPREIGARTIAELQGADDGLEVAQRVGPTTAGRGARRRRCRCRRHHLGHPPAQDPQGRSRWRSSRSKTAHGTLEVVVFPETYKTCRAHVESGRS